MQAADLREGDDCAGGGTLNGPTVGRVFPEREVR
jgi:hypothetical protein